MRVFRRERAGIFSRGGKLTARSGWTALMYACEKGRIECARLLLENGADVEAKCPRFAASCVFSGDAVASDPDSALHWAAADPQSRVSLGIG